jgi:hypothetical protein
MTKGPEVFSGLFLCRGVIVRKILILSLMFVLVSCATLFSDSSDKITFTSEPSDAQVYLNGVQIGKTPLTYEVDRATFQQSEIVIKKDGYESKNFMLGRTLATASIFNLTSWLSWLTDATSGNMIEYSPRAYFIDLRKVSKAQAEIKRAYFVMINHKALLNDFGRGQGEYLDGFLKLSELTPAKQDKMKSHLVNNSWTYFQYVYPNDIYRQLEIDLKTL